VAQPDFDPYELLDALRAGGDVDKIRRSVEFVLQALIEVEATEAIGAAPYERSEARTAQRNGHRSRVLTTKAGDVELAIPKLRRGSFFPSILERRRRIDRALFAVVMEAYVHGVSTRKVDDLVHALGAPSGMSKSEVSRICSELDKDLDAFRTRPLGWTAFLKGLRARGLGEVKLVISDHHLGLKEAIAKVFVGASWQRCRVHFMRNALAKVPRAQAQMVAAAIRTIFAQADRSHVRTQLSEVAGTLRRQFPDVADKLEDAGEDLIAFSAFPSPHWTKLWSTNPLELVNAEIKRRTNVVGIFPNDASILRLVSAVLVEQHDEWAVAERRYLSEESMTLLEVMTDELDDKGVPLAITA
jgi:transposase-like protein